MQLELESDRFAGRLNTVISRMSAVDIADRFELSRDIIHEKFSVTIFLDLSSPDLVAR